MSIILRVLLLLLLISLQAQSLAASTWYSTTDKKVTLNVELYLSSTCPHCHKADSFFKEIEPQAPWLHVSRYVINQDKAALSRFNQMLIEQHADDFAVPSIFFCGSRWVGFVSPETTGKDLLQSLQYCKEQIEKDGQLSNATVTMLQQRGYANIFQAGMTKNPSPTEYILTVGLLDSVNPCALFCFIGLLSILFLSRNNKESIQCGLIYIVVIGVLHYLQQAYNTVFPEIVLFFRVLAVLIGISLVYRVYQLWQKKSNPISERWLLVHAFLLAIILPVFQQTCLLNWSYIYAQWIDNQRISISTHMIYQLSYHLLSLTAYFIFFGLYLLLRTKWRRYPSQFFNYFGLIFLGLCGLMLVVYPYALASLALSYLTVLVIVLLSWYLNR